MIDGILAMGYAQQLVDSLASGLDHAEDVGDNTIRFYWTNNTTTDVVLNPADKVNETGVVQTYPYIHATTKETVDSFTLYIPSGGTWKLQLLGNCQKQDIDNTYKLSYKIEGEEEVVISEGTMIEHADDPNYWQTTSDIEYSINVDGKTGKKIEVKFEWTNKTSSSNYLQFIAITEHTTDLKSVPDYLRYNRYLIKNSLEF